MFTPPYDASTSRASSISNALTRTRHTASALALMMSLMACQSTQSTSESPQTAQPQGERAQREQSRDVTPQSEKRLDSNALSKATATTAAPKSEPQRATPTESAEAVASSGDASGRSLNAQAGATLADRERKRIMTIFSFYTVIAKPTMRKNAGHAIFTILK